MHRHTLPRLPNVPSGIRYTLSRQRSSTSTSSAWQYARNNEDWDDSRPTRGGKPFDLPRKARKPSPRQHGDYEPKPVAKALRSLLSPATCALLAGKRVPVKRAEEGAAKALPPPSALPPSMEQLAFQTFEPTELSNDTSSLPEANDSDAFRDMDERFSAGTFVEIRRNGARAFGVVLYTILVDRRWTVYTLTERGELWPHYEHDVQFQIPDFVDKKVVEDCGMTVTPTAEAQIDARVELLKNIRDFSMQLERTLHAALENARAVDFYGQVAHPDGKTWSQVSIYDAAEILYGTRTVSLRELLAAQTYLMDEGSLYVAEQRRFLKKQTFWVRPREDVEVIKAMHKMTIESDPAIDAFADKARSIILASRQRAAESFNESPSRHPLEGVELTEKDKTIIRFLRASLRAMRHIQHDPFSTPFSHLLKRIGLYDLDLYDESTVNVMLTEMGVLAPWQETITRDEARRDEHETIDLQPTRSTPLLPEPFGPQDLYRGDAVDALRHDFGNTPVYVIDDWGAEELDDGVSIERIPSEPDHFWIHIHIADPTTLLPPTHEISRNAFRLSTTNYLLDRTIRMLPPDAGFHDFSLGHQPGQPDKVMTFSVKVDPLGEIADYRVRPAVVRNVRTLKYDTIDAALGIPVRAQIYPFNVVEPPRRPLDLSSVDAATLEDLRLLRQTTRKLLRARVKKGAVTMCVPLPNLQLDPRPLSDDLFGTTSLVPFAFRGFPKITYGIEDTRETGARQIVSECMKVACRVASLFFRDRGIPALRRSVGAMQSEIEGGIQRVLDARDEDGLTDYYITIRNLVTAPAGRYMTTPGPHALLGVPEDEGYVKVTSPLRRFGDLFAHWQIKHALLAAAGDKASPVLYEDEWLTRFGDELETRELVAKRQERIQLEYWAHLYVQRWQTDPRAGEREHDPLQHLTGRLLTTPYLNTRTKDDNCRVYIQELGLQGMLVDLPVGTGLGLADEVNVKIKLIKLGMRPMLEVVLR